MGRKNLYETRVKPYLQEISEWYQEFDEGQIAREKLHISVSTFENYKNKYPELRAALIRGKETLESDLKASLKKKAKGFYYTETKTCIREVNGKKEKVIEKYERYAQPDTGAIHLLLKNISDEWRNDDMTTVELKRKQIELTERKIEASEW